MTFFCRKWKYLLGDWFLRITTKKKIPHRTVTRLQIQILTSRVKKRLVFHSYEKIAPHLGYCVEYDLDDRDEEWLKVRKEYVSNNNNNDNTGKTFKIDEDTLETTIDFLEKCSFKEVCTRGL